MSHIDTLRMPEHEVAQGPHSGLLCRGGVKPGYAQMYADGTLHCTRCGWVTPEPVVTAYSPETDSTYLSWDELVAAESNGWVVVGMSDRPNTVSQVVGPFEERGECEKARNRLRRKWQREENELAPGKYKITTSVRPLWKENRR